MSRFISFDFETHLISAEEPSPRPICLSYYDGTNKGVLIGDQMEQLLTTALNSEVKIIAHNMTFEALVIWNHFPKLKTALINKINKGQLICTKVYEQLLDNIQERPGFSFALDALVKKYFNEDISEDKKNPDAWRLRYHELEGVPLKDWPAEAIKYAEDDSVWAYQIYTRQRLTPIDVELSIQSDFYLNLMGQYGMEVDISRVLLLEKELLGIITPQYEAMEKAGIAEKQSNGKYKKKMNKLREYVEEYIEEPVRTAKGSVSTTSESISKYLNQVEKDSEPYVLFNNFLQTMKYEKILTAFVSRLKTAQDLKEPKIRTQYRAAVSSGRTSSSTSSFYPSVNIQQMPRSVPNVTYDIRNCFIPRKGYKIVSIDYAGLELASTANQLSNITRNSAMLNTINKGDSPIDMHSMFAYRIKNMKEKCNETYESFVVKKKEPGYAEYRQLAKPINLGFPGGIGYDTMRTLLARDGIYPKLKVIEKAQYENTLSWKRSIARKEGFPVRIRRTKFDEYQLIYDELVELKNELYSLYPDLHYFLTEGHTKFLTGHKKNVKNEFGEWEKEEMYAFEVNGFKRDWCMYTQVCNGFLMQSPAAIGAKKAMNKIICKYVNTDIIHPLAFVHDEIVFEVLDNDEKYDIIKDVSEILIDEMQTVLRKVRITVEAEVFDYWRKAGGEWCKTYWKDATGNLKGLLQEE